MKKCSYILVSALLGSLALLPTSGANAESVDDCTIVGSNKSESIVGTSGDDVICAAGGADLIYGLGGDDEIRAGLGNDIIYAGSGDDEVLGQAGDDIIYGSQGADDLNGGSGKDRVSGGQGEDMLEGGSGADNLSAGNGADLIDGGLGKDTILTGAGKDMCNSDPTDIRLDACIIDSDGPMFEITTTEVKRLVAGELAVFTLNVSDAAGVEGVYGSIGGAPGWVTEWCGFLIPATLTSGSNKSGTFTIRCLVPQDAVNAPYTLELSAVDNMGHASRTSIPFEITGGSGDDQSPVITEIDLPTNASAGKTFVISITATDESKVSGVYVWFLWVNGGFSDENGIYAKGDDPKLITSNGTESRFDQDYLFGDNAPAGQYKMWVSVRDSVGNRNFFDTGRIITLTK
jgi:hypothetical protein